MGKKWKWHHAKTKEQAKKIHDYYFKVKGKDVRMHKSKRGGWTIKERD